jgi:hypothetical protein
MDLKTAEQATALRLVPDEADADDLSHLSTRSVRQRPLYGIWRGMIERCTNPNSASYRYYGARGIRVCEQWSASYDSFERDVGKRPSPDHTIDRIDNDGHYEPDNCRWATWTEQARNRSDSIIVEHDGKTMPLGDWGDFLGIPADVLRRRHAAGWSASAIVATPYVAPLADHPNTPTERQAEVLTWIVTFLDANGFPPTLRQIGAAMSIRSTNGINDHLKALVRKGCLERSAMASRGIAVTLYGRAVVGLSRRCPHCKLGIDT